MPNREAHSRGPSSDDIECARALLAKALANHPVNRELVTEAYRLLAGLPGNEEEQ